MNIKCTVTVIVICNVIIVRANINILNREIESRFSDNPKKKEKEHRRNNLAKSYGFTTLFKPTRRRP